MFGTAEGRQCLNFSEICFPMSDFPANLTDLKVPIFSKTAPDVVFWHLFPLRPMQQKVTLVYQAVYSA